MKYTALVEEGRGGIVENIHIGIICGVDDQLESFYQVGDEEHYTYFRSASKPIQALPVFLTDIIEKYGLTEQEAALFTASHRGEPYHIKALESMLAKLPVKEEELYCPPSYPLNIQPREEMIRQGIQKGSFITIAQVNIWGLLQYAVNWGFRWRDTGKKNILCKSTSWKFFLIYQASRSLQFIWVLMAAGLPFLPYL